MEDLRVAFLQASIYIWVPKFYRVLPACKNYLVEEEVKFARFQKSVMGDDLLTLLHWKTMGILCILSLEWRVSDGAEGKAPLLRTKQAALRAMPSSGTYAIQFIAYLSAGQRKPGAITLKTVSWRGILPSSCQACYWSIGVLFTRCQDNVMAARIVGSSTKGFHIYCPLIVNTYNGVVG